MAVPPDAPPRWSPSFVARSTPLGRMVSRKEQALEAAKQRQQQQKVHASNDASNAHPQPASSRELEAANVFANAMRQRESGVRPARQSSITIGLIRSPSNRWGPDRQAPEASPPVVRRRASSPQTQYIATPVQLGNRVPARPARPARHKIWIFDGEGDSGGVREASLSSEFAHPAATPERGTDGLEEVELVAQRFSKRAAFRLSKLARLDMAKAVPSFTYQVRGRKDPRWSIRTAVGSARPILKQPREEVVIPASGNQERHVRFQQRHYIY